MFVSSRMASARVVLPTPPWESKTRLRILAGSNSFTAHLHTVPMGTARRGPAGRERRGTPDSSIGLRLHTLAQRRRAGNRDAGFNTAFIHACAVSGYNDRHP